MYFLVGQFLISLALVPKAVATPSRANVSLRMSLNSEISPRCDETVYKVIVCAGEFTNECRLFGPAARFIQSSCASQGPPEPFNFEVTSVENLIELDVKVRRVGEQSEQHLRRTEFRLTDRGEISATSLDLNLIVRFYADYVCLPNYFGKLCDKFCDQKAPEHICDEFGNPKCRSDYFWDTKTSSCRLDLCSRMPDYCLNEGTCVTNPDRNADHPYCLCRLGFIGRRCETKQPETTTLVPETTTVTTETQRRTNRPTGSLDGEHYQQESRVPNLEISPINHSKLIRNAYSHSPVKDPRKYSAGEKLGDDEEQERKRTEFKWGPTVSELDGGHRVRQLTGDDEPRMKRILLPILVVILMFALLLVCAGFVVWIAVRRRKQKTRSSSKRTNPPDSLDFQAPPKRWASVDNSPTRFCGFMHGHYPPLPSLNECAFFGEPPLETADLQCGSPVYPNFQQPVPFPSAEAINHYSVGGIPDCGWNYDTNRFSTLPRNLTTLQRRRTMEPFYVATTVDPNRIYTGVPTTLNNGSYIDPRFRASTILGPLLSDPPQTLQPLDNGSQFLQPPGGSLTPSVHGICSNKLETTPLNTSYLFPSFITPMEGKPSTTGSLHQEECSHDQDVSSTTPAHHLEEEHTRQSPGNPSQQIPSPPLEFSDSFLSSLC
ncbi:hypothetical protein CRM22_000037 [Opisthorchis felineus]|uniref:EGF-like domain-containing protein n=1 Tax=Opisthorchis felineus TaxID=147828 RepID=A0A4V3SHF6_OPIFE|nr:hypothetical protein CRM22_000037 [Opisthorchis felineus]